MNEKRELFELATEFAGKLRAVGVTSFEGLGIKLTLDPPTEPMVSTEMLAKHLGIDEDVEPDGFAKPRVNPLDDPDTFPGGFMPRLPRPEKQ